MYILLTPKWRKFFAAHFFKFTCSLTVHETLMWLLNVLWNNVYWIDWRMLFERQMVRVGMIHKSKCFQEFIEVNVAIFVHVYTFCQIFNGVNWDIGVSMLIKKTTRLLKFFHWNIPCWRKWGKNGLPWQYKLKSGEGSGKEPCGNLCQTCG